MAATPVPSPARNRARLRVAEALRAGRDHRQWQRRAGDLMEVAAVGVVVAVVAQFLVDGGSHDLTATSTYSVLDAVGRVTGLVAVDLLLLQILLAARVPWVDRVYGMDRALRAHRILGRVSLPLVLVHVETLVIAYAVRDRLSLWRGVVVEPFRMLADVPHMITATVSTALLVLVAVTSVRFAARSLGYERWHLVHLTAYAAVGLSVPHQLAIGSDLGRTGWVRTYWIGLYVVVAASVVWWRLLIPVLRSMRHGLRVEEVVAEGPNAWSVVMTGRGLDRMPVRAGQFLGFRFLAPGMWSTAHPWSLSSHPDGRTLRITVRDLGDHSRRVADLRSGTRVLIEGPYGAFTTAGRVRRRMLLIGAGIGVTPIRALLEEVVREGTAHPGDVTVLLRANAKSELVLVDELEALCRRSGHHLSVLLGPVRHTSWFPAAVRGRNDADRLTHLVPHLTAHEVYVCGPPAWMDLVHTSLLRAGVPSSHIHDERFVW